MIRANGLRGRLLSTIALAPLLLCPATAHALVWQNPGVGDFFDGANWDGAGAVPGPGDLASISNGGTAQATTAPVSVSNLLLGADPALGLVQSGALDVNGFDVNVSGSSAIGVARDPFGTSTGSLTITGGSLSAGGTWTVGNTTNAANNANATGTVSVTGAISGAAGNLLVGYNIGEAGTAVGAVNGQSYTGNHGFVGIGRDIDVGSGTGSLIVTDALSLGAGVSFLEVGAAVLNGLVADGTLAAGSGDVQTSATVSIGVHQGASSVAGSGDARGTVSLGGTLSNVGNGQFRLGMLGANRSGIAEGTLTAEGLSGYGPHFVGVAQTGASGSATGTLTVGAGGVAGSSLQVGTSDGATTATGTVNVADGGIALTGSLTVGDAGGSGATADGSVTVLAGDLSMGGAFGVGNVSGGAGASSTGSVSVAGAILGGTGNLYVGQNFAASGTANGTVSGQSYAGDHSFVAIGRDAGGGSGTGSLIVTDALSLGMGITWLEVGYAVIDGLEADGMLSGGSGDMQTSLQTSIGSHQGATVGVGNAHGAVSFDGTLTNIGNSTLRVGVLGASRAGTADGTLAVTGLSGYGTQYVGVAFGGASGTATGELTVGTGGIVGRSLQVGTSDGAAAATGTVMVADGGLSLDSGPSGALIVGEADGLGASASGAVIVSGGDLSMGGNMSAGNVGGGAAGASAAGTVSVAGAITGVTGNLFVGWNAGAGGSADGSVSGQSYSGDHSFVGIGRDTEGGSGTGSLIVTDALSLGAGVTWFEVGFAVLDGLTADGVVSAGSGDVQTSLQTAIGSHQGATVGTGNARGSVSLGGVLSNTGGSTLQVGVLGSGRSGAAEGSLTVEGLSGYGTQYIGAAFGSSSGTATGTLTVGTGGITGGSMQVGTSNGADASGTVEVSGGDVDLGPGSLSVGTLSSSTGGNAQGSLRVTGGSLLLGGSLGIGNISGTGAGKTRATVDVTGGTLAAGAVSVGEAFGSGSSDGNLSMKNVTGTISSLQVAESFVKGGKSRGEVQLVSSELTVDRFVALGGRIGGDTSNARLTLRDSRMTVGSGPDPSSLAGDMYVATSGADSVAEVSLQRSLIEVTDTLAFGAGAVLDLHLGGTVRGIDYGAIDAHQAFLGGVLDIRFDFVPLLDDLMFDLIVSGLPDGITGDFASVNLFGLGSGYTATTGIVTDTVGSGLVEIYRLTIARNDAVPEAPALILFGCGIGGLLFLCRRRGAGRARAAG